MGKKFFIETFGCQMNELDSEKIAGSLRHDGLEPAGSAAAADVLILNTCSVREKAVQKVYTRLGEIRRIKQEREQLVVGVVGCMAQMEGANLTRRAPFVDIVAGPQKGQVLGRLLDEAAVSRSPVFDLRMDDDPEPLEAAYVLRENPWRASVTISEGCNRKCSFCIVPFTRGRQRDRESAQISHEVEELVSKGYLEIMLLGQTVNAYRDPSPGGMTFTGLLRRLASIPGVRRIRFTAPHPGEFDDGLFAALDDCQQICNQIHLPVQSGSDRILRSMRRGYTRKAYLEIVARLRRCARPISISTDIIVGFPGESEQDFQDTLRLLDEVQYDCVFSFKYSPRPGTAALELPGEVPEEEKGTRLRILQAQQKLIQFNRNAAWQGREVEVLVEGRPRNTFSLSGRMSTNRIVNFDGPDSLMGCFAKVLITGFSANALKGVLSRSAVEEA